MGIRDFVKAVSPSWAQDGVFERYLYNIGLAADGVIEKAYQAVYARLPLKADPTALAYLGQDRIVPPGLTEPSSSYAVRLQRSFDGWQLAGLDWGLLSSAISRVLSLTPAARLVTDRYSNTGTLLTSKWNSYAANADTSSPPTYALKSHGLQNFDWDSLSGVDNWGWWRQWLVIYAVAPNDWAAPPAWAWDDPITWDTIPGSWGLSVTADVVSSIRTIVDQRMRSGAWCRWIIVSFDGTLFDPTMPRGGGVNPDGYFGRWSKIVNGQYVPARFADAEYCDGVF